ncbi:hypothetical protein Mapa_015011 [Marchantia paleacea]|nr:hypothetical protein Mapa_015011 [Marchantia paleacea]
MSVISRFASKLSNLGGPAFPTPSFDSLLLLLLLRNSSNSGGLPFLFPSLSISLLLLLPSLSPRFPPPCFKLPLPSCLPSSLSLSLLAALLCYSH